MNLLNSQTKFEPMSDKKYQLLQLPDVIGTPHIGYVEKRGYEYLFSSAFEKIIAFTAGNPVNIVNEEVFNKEK